MINVRIIKNWEENFIRQQTPESSGIWDDIYFTEENLRECDYVIVINYSTRNTEINCPKENIWCILQEPPNEYFRILHGNKSRVYSKVFTCDPILVGNRYVHSQPAIPWHIVKTYDILKKIRIPEKPKSLSFITSSKTNFLGHRERMAFLSRIKNNLNFDLFGFGFKPIENKWDGLAPYKYSLVVENYQGKDYWSEKLADCFLSWTMPIYYGCTNIDDFFPRESLAVIDINSLDAIGRINEVIHGHLWERNIAAIQKARDLILDNYQFFPFLANQIKKHEKIYKTFQKIRVNIPNENDLKSKVLLGIRRLV